MQDTVVLLRHKNICVYAAYKILNSLTKKFEISKHIVCVSKIPRVLKRASLFE